MATGFQAFNMRFRGDGAAPAGDAVARGRQPQVRVRMVQINLRALLQLAVMAIILYQVQATLPAPNISSALPYSLAKGPTGRRIPPLICCGPVLTVESGIRRTSFLHAL